MSKSYAIELSRAFRALFKDAVCSFPGSEKQLQKDCDHLLTLIETRGIHACCVDLPAVGKHFDRCLSDGFFVRDGFLSGNHHGDFPDFLGCLLERVFDHEGCLKEDADVEAIYFYRQICYLAKKFRADCSEEAIHHTVESFIAVDATLPLPSRDWHEKLVDGPEAFYGRDHFYDSRHWIAQGSAAFAGTPVKDIRHFLWTLQWVSLEITAALGDIDVTRWRPRHGPGTCSDLGDHPMGKYKFAHWPSDLERGFPLADLGFHSYSAWAHSHQDLDSLRAIEGTGESSGYYALQAVSRLMAVPKTILKPRLIAAEPVANMWCQQLLRDYMYTRVESSWVSNFIRFTDQGLNQALCKQGSVDSTLATVDMTDASDRVSCAFVDALFQSNWKLRMLLASCRSHYCDIQGFGHGYVPLRKFATMGNACTFPVESIAFLAIALASCICSEGKPWNKQELRRLKGKVAVFGDDIVIPAHCLETFRAACQVLDLKVNDAKTFSRGNFRESCGIEAFRGIDITPVKWLGPRKGFAEDLSSRVEQSNNFYKRFLLHTAQEAASTIHRFSIPMVSEGSSVSLGLRCRTKPLVFAKMRYNRGLQCHEYLLPALRVESDTRAARDDSALLRFFTEVASNPLFTRESDIRLNSQTKVCMRWTPTRLV